MKRIKTHVRISFILFIALFAIVPVLAVPLASVSAETPASVNVWWPANGSHVTGTQPFKAMVPGLDVSEYEMFWQVDDGGWNWMDTNAQDYPHKEASVDISGWNWRGEGPYVVNFIARKNGVVIAQQSETIYNGTAAPAPVTVTLSVPQPAADTAAAASTTSITADTAAAPAAAVPATASTVQADPVSISSAPVATAPTPATPAIAVVPVAPAPTAAPQPVTPVASIIRAVLAAPSPLLMPVAPAPVSRPSISLYVDPNSNAAKQAAWWNGNDPSDAAAMRVLAAAPTASWFGNWNGDVENDVRGLVSAASSKGQTALLVAYDIPERDCGGFSSGGSNNPSGYSSWISAMARGIGSGSAIVILEPDALAQISCLSGADQDTRLDLLSKAVTTLKSNPNTKVYIDAGHSNWVDASAMADRLKKAGIANADGFSLNVSGFGATANETAYGTQLSSLLSGTHFVIDTSRNGNGSDGAWCNPSGRAIGAKPTFSTGNALVDAYLWIKTPGESDGNCNGGPNAGAWWPSYALQLVGSAR
jgi:endoglucanase